MEGLVIHRLIGNRLVRVCRLHSAGLQKITSLLEFSQEKWWSSSATYIISYPRRDYRGRWEWNSSNGILNIYKHTRITLPQFIDSSSPRFRVNDVERFDSQLACICRLAYLVMLTIQIGRACGCPLGNCVSMRLNACCLCVFISLSNITHICG
jgi:hypothetical protein